MQLSAVCALAFRDTLTSAEWRASPSSKGLRKLILAPLQVITRHKKKQIQAIAVRQIAVKVNKAAIAQEGREITDASTAGLLGRAACNPAGRKSARHLAVL